MRNSKKQSQFQFKIWPTVIYFALYGLIAYLVIYFYHLFNYVGALTCLISTAIIGYAILIYLCWTPPENQKKSLQTLCVSMGIKRKFQKTLAISCILIAWLGIGITLLFIPNWLGLDGWTLPGIIQFIGIIWLALGLNLILQHKRK